MNKLFITIISICILFSACVYSGNSDFPEIAETPTDAPVLEAVSPTVAPAAVPTATEAVPFSAEEIEAMLEAELGEDVELTENCYSGNNSDYVFIGSKGTYFTSAETGKIVIFSSSSTSDEPEQLYTEDEMNQIAIDELSQLCPEFFEYEYLSESVSYTNTSYCFFFTQISANGNQTGNSLAANILCDGSLKSYSIFNNEDPKAVDGDYAISQEQAIELVYEVAQATAEEVYSQEVSEVYVNLDDIENHEVSAVLNCFKGQIRWIIEINSVYGKLTAENGNITEGTFRFSALVDANTGELSNASCSFDGIIDN